jgi:hypothetical protein
MTDFEKEEFWKALGRLYDASVQLVTATEKLRETTEDLRETAVAHEKRLDKIEVVQQWLAEKERRREKEQGG